MTAAPELLLVGAVAAVGVLHTIVPDHWLPIALLARERGWSRADTGRAALQAGTGHVMSTLAIALAVWVAGIAIAQRFGHIVDATSGAALVGFGGWVAVSAWRELHAETGHSHRHAGSLAHSHGHAHEHNHLHPHEAGLPATPRTPVENDRLYVPLRGDAALVTHHIHFHRHGGGVPHMHWHDHLPATDHPIFAGFATDPPLHVHHHKTTARTALLLILGSSPMVEGIPAFFAAAKYGTWLLAAMAAVFAFSTIATYLVLCVYSTIGLRQLRLGAVERYGEVLSGGVIALVGVIFGLWPAL